MQLRGALLSLSCLGALLSCGVRPEQPDARHDAGAAVDAGARDAGAADAGAHDGGARDAGEADAGPHEAGTVDAGAAADGGRWVLEPFFGYPAAMNRRGTMAFSTTSPAGFSETFVRWADGGVVWVSSVATDAGFRDTYPTDISEDDCVTGQTRLFDVTPTGRPFVWCPGDTIAPLIADPNPLLNVRAYSISRAGIVGEISERPYFWPSRDAGWFLPALSPGTGIAKGISERGEMVGYVRADGGNTFAALWRDGGLTMLIPGSTSSRAEHVSESGVVFGLDLCGGAGAACAWFNENLPSTAVPPTAPGIQVIVLRLGNGETPLGLQNDGQLHATYWTDAGPVLLESLLPADSGWELANVYGMNGAGTVFVGQMSPRPDAGNAYLMRWQP